MFQTTKKRGALVISLLVLYGMAKLSDLVFQLYRLSEWQRRAAGTYISRSEIQTTNSGLAVSGRLSLIIFLAAGIAFLFWIHRAYRNLYSFRVQDLKYSSRQAVFSFFIPIVNLVRPYQVMQEIWKACGPPVAGDDDWRQRSTSLLLPFWWLVYLASSIIMYAGVFGTSKGIARLNQLTTGSPSASDQARSIASEIALWSKFVIFADLAIILAAALAVLVIIRINRRQNMTYAAMLEEGLPEHVIPPGVVPRSISTTRWSTAAARVTGIILFPIGAFCSYAGVAELVTRPGKNSLSFDLTLLLAFGLIPLVTGSHLLWKGFTKKKLIQPR
ncbi:MAG: DUF4328 domain-containing protein [Thermoleophilia bacterium]